MPRVSRHDLRTQGLEPQQDRDLSHIRAYTAASGKGLSHGRKAVGVERLQASKARRCRRQLHIFLADAFVGHTAPAVAHTLKVVVLWLLQEEGGWLVVGAAAAEGTSLWGLLAERGGGSWVESRPVGQHEVAVGMQGRQVGVHGKVGFLLVLLGFVLLAAVILWAEDQVTTVHFPPASI